MSVSPNLKSIVLYSGPGGVTTGLRMAGVTDSVGVEWDDAAVQTARAAGFMVEQADVSKLDPYLFACDHGYEIGDLLLLQASPPCQGLSNAGKGTGRDDLVKLLAAIEEVAYGERSIEGIIAGLWEDCSDERSPLTFEVIRWISELSPDYVMLEQVPAALPIWEAIAEYLRSKGYSVWAGNVQSERFGVPQTRKRAILLASNLHDVTEPEATHSKYHNRTPTRLDEGVLPWVSMAEALGWGETDMIGFPRKYDGRGEPVEIDGELYRARDLREAGNPSFVVTEKSRSWVRYTHMGDVYNTNGCIRQVNEPSPTLTASMDNGNFKFFHVDEVSEKVQERIHNQSGTKFDLTWPMHRPAPVVAGRDIVTMPGANANRFNGATKSRNDGVRVTVEEAGVLQSFPADYPWQGTKTKKHEQVGNAVPPLLACRLVRHLCKWETKDKEVAA